MSLHPFTAYALRKYNEATGWNDDNLYSNLTRSSDAILDFFVPHGLHFSISKAPNKMFTTTYAMTALPSLKGSAGYVFSSCNLDLKNSRDVLLDEVINRFKIYEIPQKPMLKLGEAPSGETVRRRDFLLSGLVHIPTGRLDAFYSQQLSSTLQGSVSMITDSNSITSTSVSDTYNGLNNILLSLKQDTGRWCTEYSWDSDGNIWGLRVLRNFGKVGSNAVDLVNAQEDTGTRDSITSGMKIADEEEFPEGGLRGRFSAGAEVYVGSKRSAGVSLGVRFTTLPDHVNVNAVELKEQSSELQHLQMRVQPSQPPTTITALLNPITGHILTAYTASVSSDLAVSSRFAFNINSYESEWAMGAEWWMRRKENGLPKPSYIVTHNETEEVPLEQNKSQTEQDNVYGVVKARLSTSANVALMWEGRMQNILLSLGFMSNLSNRAKPISAVGLELTFFSTE